MRGLKVRNLRKLIKDSSTYGVPVEDGRIGGDPFLTGPFARGTKLSVYFDQGDNAVEETLRRKIDPATTSVIMFPGQGTQHVGMCGDTSSMPRPVQVLYEIASSILNYDLLDLCANGPLEKLNKTVYSQPAILVSSLAALERLRDTDPDAIERCVVTSGFSIGEITALVFAGVMSFEDAIRVVKVRAEAMQLASEIVPSGMSTVLYGADSKLNYSLVVAKEWCRREYKMEEPVCSIANYLFPHCKVVAGHTEALDFLDANYKDFNLRRVKRLPVAGAFHTDLMKPAADPMRAVLDSITINRPRMPVYSNVTANRYRSSGELKKVLVKQIYKPVKWEQVIQNLYQRPKESEYPMTFECGPGASLAAVLKNVNSKAHLKCKKIQP
ncbi:unnamed protein product [Orchesella dallaii]|uniref:Malonyl-CoA:ACP transacylase (MAT) domain-containing protein n=1 Tax=Orchesella dallaii TaxID=48710 RepID=A0ABP1QIM1_9HEXA